MKVVSIVGMTGAGKSEVARVFEKNGFIRIRFGDVTDEELVKRGLEPAYRSYEQSYRVCYNTRGLLLLTA